MSAFALADTYVFDKQSLGPILCGLDLSRLPLSLSYRVILPSSLTSVFSRVLVYSTHPPVSVYGTGTLDISLEAFLETMTSCTFT